MKNKNYKRILIWGNNFNSEFVFNELKKLYITITIIDLDKPFLIKLESIINNDIIYVISGKIGISLVLARLLGKLIVMHWVGTDVIKYNKSNKLVKLLYRIVVNKHIFVSFDLLNEFSKKVKPRIFPIIRKAPFTKVNFMIGKNILTYIPQGREEFYYGYFITEYFKSKKDYNLHVIGNNGVKLAQAINIMYYGWTKNEIINELIANCSIYIRFVKHDGFPKLVTDNLYNFNFVIYNHNFPYTLYCKPEKNELNKSLDLIYKNYHSLKQNVDQYKYIGKMYKKYRISKLLEVLLDK